jgi:CTP synthase
MKYLCLIYQDESVPQNLPKAEAQKIHGEYLAFTDEIKRRILLLGNTGEYDIVITEIGGTVGDIESLPYIEALRQLKWELGNINCIVIHLTLIPYLKSAKELKTKPTQHSVKDLLEEGVQPTS